MYRTIVELSGMTNNDEYILYTKKQLTHDDIKHGRLVISRPVFEIELEDGLRVEEGVTVSKWADSPFAKSPEITQFLDSLFNMKFFTDASKSVSDKLISPERFVRHYATQYYDCMSGGLPKWAGLIVKEFAEIMNIDKNMELYPKEDGYYTLKDFCREFTDEGDSLKTVMSRLQGELPPLNKFLLPKNSK